jgi:hypothetical protein
VRTNWCVKELPPLGLKMGDALGAGPLVGTTL